MIPLYKVPLFWDTLQDSALHLVVEKLDCSLHLTYLLGDGTCISLQTCTPLSSCSTIILKDRAFGKIPTNMWEKRLNDF